MKSIARIYDHFERELTPATRAAMEARIVRNPRHAHGAHAYALEKYGLSPADVRERFAAYVERFDLAWD